MEYTVEVCAGSYQDCLAAYKGGAKRVELNSALSVGGLTCGLSTLKKVKEDTDLQVICMVRPRAGGFCYDPEDVEIMFEDARLLLINGADGIAFGFLNMDSTVQAEYTRQMTDIIHSYHRIAVFHRAFDVTANPYDAMQDLISCKVDRVLTSGQQEKALAGVKLINELQRKYGKKIEILPGSGINAENARWILERTGVHQLHSSCKGYHEDPTTSNNHVSYSYLSGSHINDYEVVDAELVQRLVNSVKQAFSAD